MLTNALLSFSGSLVMKIDATDADDPTSPNSKIAFRIISQEPSQPSAFQIDRETGEVWTSTYQLDREVNSFYSNHRLLILFHFVLW